jgi:hypothetical protein
MFFYDVYQIQVDSILILRWFVLNLIELFELK